MGVAMVAVEILATLIHILVNMAFALLIIGLSLVIVSVRNTQATFTARVANDFKGSGNFVYWIVAILIIGAIGYIPKAKPVSDLFLVLILLVLFLKKGNPSGVGGGFFQQFTQSIGATASSAASKTLGMVPTGLSTS